MYSSMAPTNFILSYLENKTLLVTGSTGFVGKIFVEKVLRAQPKVNKIFLVIRTSAKKTIQERLHDEVIGMKLFNVLREKYGDGFHSFIAEKVHPVAGNVADEDFGIVDTSLVDLILTQTDVIVNIAATTRFDERYDVALQINTLGAKNTIEFAKKCERLQMLLHVSTAYVVGEKSGVILEKEMRMGVALNGAPGLNVDGEVNLAIKTLNEVQSSGASKTVERETMRNLGMERAKNFGWPNTYSFSKSMGEMLIGEAKGNLPVAIMRPTIITSTFKEPFPGWIEGNRTVDTFITAYAKRQLSFVLGDAKLIVDVIPGDMVANAMIAIMAYHLDRPSKFIYHVGSSSRNPLTYAAFGDCMYRGALRYAKGNNRRTNIPRLRFLSSKEHYYLRMRLFYKVPLLIMHIANFMVFNVFRNNLLQFGKNYNYAIRLAKLYEPYGLFKGVFDDHNLKQLMTTVAKDRNQKMMFDFDTRNINWSDYFVNTHIANVLENMRK